MPNHYHLMLSPVVENGISLFIKKLNGGYARYFNERYERSGALFQGRYKRVQITEEKHFIHLPYYIHLNPLDMTAPEWRQKKINNFEQTISYLDNYRWSSHLDYAGKNNFSSVTDRSLLSEYFGESRVYRDGMIRWLKERRFDSLGHVLLEK